MTTLERKTSAGLSVRIVVEPDTIRAYRVDPAEIVMHDFRDGGERVSVEPELSRYFTKEPVMEIRKRGNGDYVVEFEAGFQRGRVTVSRAELTQRAHWPQDAPGYLRWIGLSARDPEVREWLAGGIG